MLKCFRSNVNDAHKLQEEGEKDKSQTKLNLKYDFTVVIKFINSIINFKVLMKKKQ